MMMAITEVSEASAKVASHVMPHDQPVAESIQAITIHELVVELTNLCRQEKFDLERVTQEAQNYEPICLYEIYA